MAIEIFGTPGDELSLGAAQDYLEQVGELRKRYYDIRSTSKTNLFKAIEVENGLEVFKSDIGDLLQLQLQGWIECK